MQLIRKRKLSHQQTRRIKQQNENIDNKALAKGVVVSHFGRQMDVFAEEVGAQTVQYGQIYRCHARTNLGMLAAGDGVLFSFDSITKLGCIEKILARTSLIARPDRYHKLKPVASGVDIIAIVFAAKPLPSFELIDRYLVVAHHANIAPLLILNKNDIASDNEHEILQQYHALNIDTLSICAHDNIDALYRRLQNKRTVFVGQSGVGKSSLINALLPTAAQNTTDLSTLSNLGKHTTTTSRFLPFDAQNLTKGGVIDTPGIREYGVWHLSKDDVIQGFSEMQALVHHCHFRDCTHQKNSKGCALWQAHQDGMVLKRRIESLCTLQQEANGLT